MKRSLVGAVAVLLSLTGAAWSESAVGPPDAATGSADEAANAMVLDETSTDPVAVAVGDRIEVHLQAQFGSGYSWKAVEIPQSLERLGETTAVGEASADGRSDVQIFTFAAAAPGVATLQFAYRRPWQTAAPAKLTAVFQIDIAGK